MRLRLILTSEVLKDSALFAKVARRAIESAVMVNIATLRKFPQIPSLYQSGVRYRKEPEGVEDVCDIEEILRRGWADCAMLVAYRIAELRVREGERATMRFKWMRRPNTKKRFFHVLVRRADGRVEDPSIRLGMHSGHGVTVGELPLNYRRVERVR